MSIILSDIKASSSRRFWAIQAFSVSRCAVWQDQVDWARSLPPDEQPLLQAANINLLEMVEQSNPAALEIPSEQLLYETLKEKSHFSALCDSLRMMVQPETRQDYEAYVIQQAEKAGHRVLTEGNLQQMTDVSVANLYWYFQVQDESEQELEDEGQEE